MALDYFMGRIAKLSERLDLTPTFRWAVVTQVSPLKIRFDAETADEAGTPDTLIADPPAGARVQCLVQHRRVTVVGLGRGRVIRAVTWATSSLAAGAEVEIDVDLPRLCEFERLITSSAARVRLYDRAAKSAADASRASGVLPSGDHGLLVEADGGTTAEDITWNPRVLLTNRDDSTTYKMRVKNLGASSTVITGSLYIA